MNFTLYSHLSVFGGNPSVGDFSMIFQRSLEDLTLYLTRFTVFGDMMKWIPFPSSFRFWAAMEISG